MGERRDPDLRPGLTGAPWTTDYKDETVSSCHSIQLLISQRAIGARLSIKGENHAQQMALNGWDVYVQTNNGKIRRYTSFDGKSEAEKQDQTPRRPFIPKLPPSPYESILVGSRKEMFQRLQQGNIIDEENSRPHCLHFQYSSATVSSALLEHALKEEIQGVRREMTNLRTDVSSLTTHMDVTLGTITDLVSSITALIARK